MSAIPRCSRFGARLSCGGIWVIDSRCRRRDTGGSRGHVSRVDSCCRRGNRRRRRNIRRRSWLLGGDTGRNRGNIGIGIWHCVCRWVRILLSRSVSAVAGSAVILHGPRHGCTRRDVSSGRECRLCRWRSGRFGENALTETGQQLLYTMSIGKARASKTRLTS